MNEATLRAAGITRGSINGSTRVNRTRRLRRAQIAQLRRLDAPDERRKVAGCPKCPSWFETVEARNAHREYEHGPDASERRRREAAEQDASDAAMAVEEHGETTGG